MRCACRATSRTPRATATRSAFHTVGGVGCADGFGFGGAALAEVDREHGHRADGEELRLPVLECAVPEVAGGDVLQPADGGFLVVELLGVVVGGEDVAAERDRVVVVLG